MIDPAMDVQALDGLSLQALRDVWETRYGAPPALRSVDILRRMLAWRMQAEAAGGLDGSLARALRVRGHRSAPAPALAPGVRVGREWKGRLHEVEIGESGCFYDGRRYASLSAVACEITGVRWNGPRFFGLRETAS